MPLRLSFILAAALAAAGAHAQTTPARIHDFIRDDGGVPYAAPALSADGYLYGTTSEGGTSGWGTIYRVRPDGSDFQSLHSFDWVAEGAGFGGVIEGRDGALYGTTRNGDSNGSVSAGAVFRMAKDGSGYTTLHAMAANGGDGGVQNARLAQDADGVLYGVSTQGGSTGLGTVFSLRPDGSAFTVLHRFAGGLDGGAPIGALSIGADGRIYGTTAAYGAGFQGTVFTMARDGSDYRVLHALSRLTGDGDSPQSDLTDGGDGWFYGTTAFGGIFCDCGTAFRVNTSGAYETLRSLDGQLSGATPIGAPAFGPNGHLYGTARTNAGGQFAGGAIWELDRQGKLVGVYDFPMPELYAPTGNLVLGPDKRFYTVANYSKPNDYGAVISFDPATQLAPPVMPPVFVSMNLNPTRIRAGHWSELTWYSENAGKCVASGDWSGHKRINGPAGIRLHPTEPGTYTYTLTCSNTAGSMSATQTLEVLKDRH